MSHGQLGQAYAPSVLKREQEIAVGLSTWSELQCASLAGDGFVHISLVLEGGAEVVVRLSMIWLQLQGPAMADHRFVQLALFPKGVAQIAVRLGVVRL